MATALYRRYRPETFAELIGQSQVTDPLRTALRTDRVNHAYLFSGPRGCGKTTSARILARCLNCAEGPTDTPCGVCPSCVELSRDGGGSLDVVEIDAASHNGVDDARDIRERAIFAPARDRYKIFILDEAHMVTPQGFNALLKIVEEPPEHVKFIFATTEPEKVIGTIRSRTHHYPFRLVPPAQMLEYVQQLCDAEHITVAPGVLGLVVRAGGGSVRDTLSLLDQLMSGSEIPAESVGVHIDYARAVALLGFTNGALLDEVVDSIGARDAAAAFAAVDRIIQTGQDPRRFVEDLLERLRDLIIVAATGEGANAVLRGIPQDELDRMAQQARRFGAAELSRAADVANAALTEMTGATSPRLHLELMIARILIPASDETERGALARVERLERRIGIAGAEKSVGGTAGQAPAGAGAGAAGAAAGGSRAVATSFAGAGQPTAAAAPAASAWPAASSASPTPAAEPGSAPGASGKSSAPIAPTTSAGKALAPSSSASSAAEPLVVTLQQVRDAWPEILELVEKAKRSAWMVVFTSQARALSGDILTLTFPSETDVANFRQPPVAGEGVSEHLRRAILDVLGIRVKFIARVEPTLSDPAPRALSVPPAIAPDDARHPSTTPGAGLPAAPGGGSNVGVAAGPAGPEGTAGPAGTVDSPASQSRPTGLLTQERPAPERPSQDRPVQGRPAGPTTDRSSTPSQRGTPNRRGAANIESRRPASASDASFEPREDDYAEPIEPDLEPDFEPTFGPGAGTTGPAVGKTAAPAVSKVGAPNVGQAATPVATTAAPDTRKATNASRTRPIDVKQPDAPDAKPVYAPGEWAVASIPGSSSSAVRPVAVPPAASPESASPRNSSPAPQPAASAGNAPAVTSRPTDFASTQPTQTQPTQKQPAPTQSTPHATPLSRPVPSTLDPRQSQRYGESVVREVLHATFIEEESVAPRVVPMPRND